VLSLQIKKRLLPVCEDLKSTHSCTRGKTIWIPGSTGSQLLYSQDTVRERQENGTVIYNKSCGYFETGRERARVMLQLAFRMNMSSVYRSSRWEAPLFHKEGAYSVLPGNAVVAKSRKRHIPLQLSKTYSVLKSSNAICNLISENYETYGSFWCTVCNFRSFVVCVRELKCEGHVLPFYVTNCVVCVWDFCDTWLKLHGDVMCNLRNFRITDFGTDKPSPMTGAEYNLSVWRSLLLIVNVSQY
jgi:hypothetical protein